MRNEIGLKYFKGQNWDIEIRKNIYSMERFVILFLLFRILLFPRNFFYTISI